MAFARSKTNSFDTRHRLGGLQSRLKAKMEEQKKEPESPSKVISNNEGSQAAVTNNDNLAEVKDKNFNSASPKKAAAGGNSMQAFGFRNRLGKKENDDDKESVASTGMAGPMFGLRR